MFIVLFCFLVLNFETFIYLKPVYIRNHLLFISIFFTKLSQFITRITRNSSVKYQFFIIWFSRTLIISFPPLLSAAQFHPMWKLTVLIKLCLSQIAFDLKGMISSLCSSARAGAWGLKDWPRFRGKKTTSRLSHTWKVFPKVQKTFILFMYNNFVRESDTPVASWVWLSHCPGHLLCTAVHHGSVFLWI